MITNEFILAICIGWIFGLVSAFCFMFIWCWIVLKIDERVYGNRKVKTKNG